MCEVWLCLGMRLLAHCSKSLSSVLALACHSPVSHGHSATLVTFPLTQLRHNYYNSRTTTTTTTMTRGRKRQQQRQRWTIDDDNRTRYNHQTTAYVCLSLYEMSISELYPTALHHCISLICCEHCMAARHSLIFISCSPIR